MKLIILGITLLVFTSAQAEITVYHDRPKEKIEHMAQAFTQKTGIAVTVTDRMAPETLRETLVSEGSSSSADVTIVKDLVYMTGLTDEKLIQPLNSNFAKANVASSMQSDLWTAITYRARTLVYHKSLDVSAINTYADLANLDSDLRLCLRTSTSSYNKGLGASLVKSYGYDQALEIVEGWLASLSPDAPIFGSDSKIIKSIVGIEGFGKNCDLGITNSYYLGSLLKTYPDLEVGIKFLELKDGGVSTNGIIAGINESSDSVDEARQFIEFMLSQEMQEYFSGANQDFPANQNVAFDQNIQAWQGTFTPSELNWAELGQSVPDADDLFFEVGYP